MISIKNFIRYFFMFIWNSIICHIPSYNFRYFILKYIFRAKLGKCTIHRNVKLFSPWKLQVGDGSNIQMDSFIDCRGGVIIGNNVDITLGIKIISEYHDIQSSTYVTISSPVKIEDYCVIGSFAIILPGVTLREGTVIGSGSVVTKSTDEYSLYCGSPAIFKKSRSRKLIYHPYYKRPFH